MSKPKQYDRTELLNRAIELFRRQGFNGTSTAQLVAELGVNRKSMYAEFGSKQELFLATLDHYNSHNLAAALGPLEHPEAGLKDIRNAFRGYASAGDGPFSGLGCLMCNSAVERGALDPETGRFVDAYLERITKDFRHALVNEKERGQLDKKLDLNQTAAFLTTNLIGIAASVRAKAPPAQLWSSFEVLSNFLDGLNSQDV